MIDYKKKKKKKTMTQRIFFENIKNGSVITDEMKKYAIAELEKLEQKENDKIKEKRRGCFVEGVVSKIPFQR